MDIVKHTTRVVSKYLKVKVEIRLKVHKETSTRYFVVTATSRERGSFLDMLTGITRIPPLSLPLKTVSQHFPYLKPLVILHLCNTLGQPPHVLERGLDILRAKPKDDAMAFFRISEEEHWILFNCLDQNDFLRSLSNLEISQRWKKDGLEGLRLMKTS